MNKLFYDNKTKNTIYIWELHKKILKLGFNSFHFEPIVYSGKELNLILTYE